MGVVNKCCSGDGDAPTVLEKRNNPPRRISTEEMTIDIRNRLRMMNLRVFFEDYTSAS